MFSFALSPVSVRQTSGLLLSVLLFSMTLAASWIQAGEGGVADSNVSTLLAKAEMAVTAEPPASPYRLNAIQDIDRVLTQDPGNPQAYVLLYSVVTWYSRLLEDLLATAHAQNYTLQLEKATGFRNQTALVVYKYGLDENILYRMDRMINQSLETFKYLSSAGGGVEQQESLPDGRKPWASTQAGLQGGGGYVVPVAQAPGCRNKLRVIGTF